MAYQETPIGQIELVGKVAYQLYSYVYYGNVKYRAKLGIPRHQKDTGETFIIPMMEDDSTRDYQAAVEIVAPLLEELRTAAFRQKSLNGTATTSSLEPTVQPTLQIEEERPQELKLVNE